MASLSAVTDSGANKVVFPTNNALHQLYTFFTKITADGGSNAYFGAYNLYVGCFTGSVEYADNAAFDVDLPLWVGDPTANVYTMPLPTSTRSWCSIQSNAIVNNDATGTTWTGAAKLVACASQPCNVWSLVDTINVETIYFKIKTTWTNSMTHLSQVATITITCNNNYALSTSGVVPNAYQVYTHGDASVGYDLPTY